MARFGFLGMGEALAVPKSSEAESVAATIQVFWNTVRETIEEYGLSLSTDDVFDEIERALCVWQFRSASSLTQFLGKPVRRLVILGCSEWLDPFLDSARDTFEEVVVFDERKPPGLYRGVNRTQDASVLERGDIDCFLVAPLDPHIQDRLAGMVARTDAVVWSGDLVKSVAYGEIEAAPVSPEIRQFVEDANGSRDALLFLGGSYSNNFSSTLNALSQAGHRVLIGVRSDQLIMTETTVERVFNDVVKLDLREMCYVASMIRAEVPVLINWDSFRINNFTGKRAACVCAYVVSLLKITTGKRVLLQYDPLSIIKSDFERSEEIAAVVGGMLCHSDRVVYSSSSEAMREMQQNLYGYTAPAINFYRYNNVLESPMPKRSREPFRLIMLGIFLGEGHGPMRAGMQEELRSILEQGVHVHYLSGHARKDVPSSFRETLSQEEKSRFVIESSFVDQKALVEHLSQFNAGWVVHNTQAMVDVMAKIDSLAYRDMLYAFLQSTMISSAFAHGCAGLPMFINRSQVGMAETFPEHFFVPIERSEIANLSGLIEGIDWDQRYELCYRDRHLFSIEHHVDRLRRFLS